MKRERPPLVERVWYLIEKHDFGSSESRAEVMAALDSVGAEIDALTAEQAENRNAVDVWKNMYRALKDGSEARENLEWAKELRGERDVAVSERLLAEREIDALRQELRELRRQLTIQGKNNALRNKQLDALHYVWCSGGCSRGVHRWADAEVTEELVAEAERNTARLRAWWQNKKGRAK